MAARPATPVRRRRFWGRYQLLAVCVIGAVAVVLIANTHPWSFLEPVPSFELVTLDVTYTGSGATGVHSGSICPNECPVRAGVGSTVTVGFLVVPVSSVNCSPSTYFTITKVTQTSTGAFSLTGVSANAGAKLPVTIPNPVGGKSCETSDEIYVAFSVSDQGPSSQTPVLEVTVTQS